ncbi:hypothetical protein K2173_013019 [Erythroxylum novogranatense]|uniref:Uncharacterized protein n=1 Tax=Erythroxylum novogranatense TaxID=1862640 RepID=A0AAV8S7B0_9ROSI|nr:hypothetical protein K2173_013019 [Erythroxylum novogranatense]
MLALYLKEMDRKRPKTRDINSRKAKKAVANVVYQRQQPEYKIPNQSTACRLAASTKIIYEICRCLGTYVPSSTPN